MQVQVNEFTYKIAEIVDNSPIINFGVDVIDVDGKVTDKKYYWFNKVGESSLEDQAFAALQKRFDQA